MMPQAFHPVIARWFEQRFGSPTEPQEHGWPSIQSGAHTLIAAPTGSGKTLAAFLAALDQLFREGVAGGLPDETRVLYVSPLKALSNDIHRNLEEPLKGIQAALRAQTGRTVDVRAAVRTGDTSASGRRALLRKPPHILVTTPESMYLLLTSLSGRKMLATVRTLIVDEIHAVVGNRRGSHLALSMERLAALATGPLQRIGLSATQKPLEEVARFLVGTRHLDPTGNARCAVINTGSMRPMDLAIEVPDSALEAVMSNEVWVEIYSRLAQLISAHRTTLVFVNTRRLAERVTHHLGHLLGVDQVASHHGSLSPRLRLDAERRLKNGELRALVATASLELGIDIGSVDLVCQLGPTRSIATLLQRVGRAQHQRAGVPKGRLFPLSRDELVECVATVRSVRQGELDAIAIPRRPLDVLAQQIVACAACQDWAEDDLFNLVRSAYPYRDLARGEFNEVIDMLAQGFSTKRGRRAALIHHDAVHHRVRARRGARLIAITSGGAIPDNGEYRVLLEPNETLIGTVTEDFAVESVAGDIFQLGSHSWRILRINAGTVRVDDAQGQPPNIPFWLGEAPGRTAEVSRAVSALRQDLESRIQDNSMLEWLRSETGLCESGAQQLRDYFTAGHKALGVIPSQQTLVLERFFDESGGMQLVVHSPFGIRVNRAWGLALRKRFCRSFNFELQAAATDDAMVLSLGTQHSFPLEDVFHYLNSRNVRDLLVQALLDSPMFPIRWRWNATRALALPRQRGNRRIPAPLQRMEAENLLAAVFPEQLACLENIVGDREIPNHPLVRQTIEDCLTEAMDVDGLIRVLQGIESGTVRCVARELPEPSPLAYEILNARPYAFLDNAPLEERRTQAVHTRRASEFCTAEDLGVLDPAAIDTVRTEVWPVPTDADEVHEALLLMGTVTPDEMSRLTTPGPAWLESLTAQRRAGRLAQAPRFWVAAERLPLIQAVYPDCPVEPPLTAPDSEARRAWERPEAVRELVRGRLEVSGPITQTELARLLELPVSEIEAALLALEREGFVLRGRFSPGAQELQWCERRLLARVHRLTLNRLRAEIQPVSIGDYQRFLSAWQRVDHEHRAQGPDGVEAVLALFDGYELPAAAWEPEVLALRIDDYAPQWLDQLCSSGRLGWGRLTAPLHSAARPFAPLRSSPIALFQREHLEHWLALSSDPGPLSLSPDTNQVWETLQQGGALFFREIQQRAGALPSRVEQALGELAARGLVTSDTFEGLRALLLPQEKRAPFADTQRPRRHRAVTSIEFAGRWSLLRPPPALESKEVAPGHGAKAHDEAVQSFAWALLRRYGVVFRRLLEKEALRVPWFELSRVFRRMEARGEIRGGFFVGGVGGEQFALPEAVGLLRSVRKAPAQGELLTISGADPLNLTGILLPGPRIGAVTAHRILLRDGLPLAALVAGEVVSLAGIELNTASDRALRVATMPPALLPYYG